MIKLTHYPEVGTKQRCPECGHEMLVPGARALQQIRAQLVQREQEKAKQQALQRQSQAAAQAAREREAHLQTLRQRETQSLAMLKKRMEGHGWINRNARTLNSVGGLLVAAATIVIAAGLIVGFVMAVGGLSTHTSIGGFAGMTGGAILFLSSLLWALPILGLGAALCVLAGIGKVGVAISAQIEEQTELLRAGLRHRAAPSTDLQTVEPEMQITA